MIQQTAIQQMIDFINDINDNDRSEFNYYYDSIITKLNELLEVEKQQIVDALETGWVMGCSKEAGKVLHTEQYYKETYGSSGNDKLKQILSEVTKIPASFESSTAMNYNSNKS